jgi:hypothetical protein
MATARYASGAYWGDPSPKDRDTADHGSSQPYSEVRAMSVIDLDFEVLRIELAGDHAHISLMSPAMSGDDNYNQPATSCSASINYDQAQLIIAELQKIRPASGKPKIVKGLQ